MALVLLDRVQQTATAVGTTSFTLTGNVAGFQTFAAIGNGNTTYYSATDALGNWEVGVGTYSTSGPTLIRTTILSSSNSSSAVTFVSKVSVFVTYPSEKSVNQDESNNVTLPASLTLGNVLSTPNGGTGASTLTGYLIGNGTSAVTASATIPSGSVSGLGTMATQDANAVAITGGTINGATIGATTPSTGNFTTLEATGTSSLGTASTTYVTITGDASYPMVKATGGTNTPLVLSPLGTGALQAQVTTSGSTTGGNARGANAVDWQTGRSAATQVASGSNSTIGGGLNNTAGAGNTVVSGGANNSSAGSNSAICGGNGNIVGTSGFVGGGNSNQAGSGGSPYSAVVGGFANTANGYLNFIGGGYTNSGTSVSAVTTQSATMNATTAVTLAASNAAIKVGQYITGTSIAIGTYVAAISGTSLTLSQAASGSSTSTLSFFTPHGVVVGGGNNQATGAYSAILGGGDAGTAANRNVASGDWSFVGGGAKNLASGIGAFVGGGGPDGGGNFYANTSSGASSAIVGGVANVSSGLVSFVGGGASNSASGSYSTVSGGNSNSANASYTFVSGGSYGTTRAIIGNHVFPSCNAPIATSTGVSQAALLVLGAATTDATATVLTSTTSAASGTNQVTLPNNSAYYFKGSVIAGKTAAGDTKGWTIEGVIKRGAGVGTTALVGTPTVVSTYADAGAATWAVTATADTTNGALAITVTGQAATTIRWVAKIETTEMTF
jgi:hypothetical protein